MEAALSLVTVRPLRSDIRFPSTVTKAYSIANFVHYNISRVSPKATSSVACRRFNLFNTSRSLLNTQNKSNISSVPGWSSVVENNNSIPHKSRKEFITELEKWANKQSLLVGALAHASYLACEIFAFTFVGKVIIDYLIPTESSFIELVLSYTGDYRSFVSSFLGSPLMYARNFALFTITYKSITYAMKRLRGGNKYDLSTAMAGGLGQGVMIALVTGLKGPRIIFIGVIFALITGSIFKSNKGRATLDHVDVDEKLSVLPRTANEDEREGGTNNLFKIIFNYWLSKVYYMLVWLRESF